MSVSFFYILRAPILVGDDMVNRLFACPYFRRELFNVGASVHHNFVVALSDLCFCYVGRRVIPMIIGIVLRRALSLFTFYFIHNPLLLLFSYV